MLNKRKFSLITVINDHNSNFQYKAKNLSEWIVFDRIEWKLEQLRNLIYISYLVDASWKLDASVTIQKK